MVPAMTARAELSALATSLDELAVRLEQINSELSSEERQSLEGGLAEVQRALDAARRRLARLAPGGS